MIEAKAGIARYAITMPMTLAIAAMSRNQITREVLISFPV